MGNYYAAHDKPDTAQPLYRTCYESFVNDPQSAACHWKITWFTYLRDPAQAEGMLREHLTRYPASDQVSPAIYYLGRIAESKSDWAAARAFYEAINKAFPNYYYAILARERLETPSIASAKTSPGTAQFLVVAGSPPHKPGGRTAVGHRLEMARIAIAGHPAFAVSDIEATRPGPHYSVETLESIRRDHPGDELFFLIGADSLADLPSCASRSGSRNWRRSSW